MDSALISVIVPVYNVEKYLDRCVESIVNQTYQNIEILLMNDGSTDSSGAQCDVWAQRDKRIRVFHLPHGGLSAARNSGLKEMNGQYILFIDSDDYVIPDLIDSTYQNILHNDADMVIFNFEQFYNSDENTEVLRKKKAGLIEKEQILYMMYGKRSDVVYLAWNKLYKRELFNNIIYPVGRAYEDNAIAHKILEKCQRIVYDENKYYFRQLRADSIMGKSKQFGIKNLDILYGQKERCELYSELCDKKLLALVYAEYLHTLIYSYFKTRYCIKDNSICNSLYKEFVRVYSIAKQKVKFDKKKTVGYFAFRYAPRIVVGVMRVHGNGKM